MKTGLQELLMASMLWLLPFIAQSQSTMEFQSGTTIEVTSGANICADIVLINGAYSGSGTKCGVALPVAEVEVGLTPKEFRLSQNFPNPFNPTTTIEFTLQEDGRVVLKLYDVTGRELATLLDEERKAGYYQSAAVDASRFGSGMYFYRLEANGKLLTRKMLLVK
jgi:hypothetical protein